MTKIKICGLKSIEDVAIVNEVMPEYVGFVFAESKRKVSKEQAIQMREVLNPKIQVVGVFVKEPMKNIVELCMEGVIDCVQLHGEETLGYVMNLKQQIEQPMIYAKRLGQIRLTVSGEELQEGISQKREFNIRNEDVANIFDEKEVNIYDKNEDAVQLEQWPVDYLLFDTYVRNMYGGSGKLIDYEGVPQLKKPIFIAGGLTAETVGAVIASIRPYCVDVSSGVETNGRKDREKILRFVEQVRNGSGYEVN